jgi:hypothetical protein
LSIALDYTSRISPVSLKAVSAVAVCRYLSWKSLSWKTITKSEYDELRAAGINVTLNWEATAMDWLGGAMAGTQHGATAVNNAEALGAPKGQVIIGSADFDMTRGQYLESGRAYAKNFAGFCRGAGFRPGVYGPYDVLTWVHDDGIMDAFWQAGMSTSYDNGRNAQPWPGAHLRQRGHMTVAGQDVDWSDILIQPLWGQPKDSDMTQDEHDLLEAMAWRVDALTVGSETVRGGPYKGETMWVVKALNELKAAPGGGPTQDQLNAAISGNVDGIGTALASHIKVI